ncbi:hypothetical protein GGI35DRAFT_307890 [Trichoderma velutinum]
MEGAAQGSGQYAGSRLCRRTEEQKEQGLQDNLTSEMTQSRILQFNFERARNPGDREQVTSSARTRYATRSATRTTHEANTSKPEGFRETFIVSPRARLRPAAVPPSKTSRALDPGNQHPRTSKSDILLHRPHGLRSGAASHSTSSPRLERGKAGRLEPRATSDAGQRQDAQISAAAHGHRPGWREALNRWQRCALAGRPALR